MINGERIPLRRSRSVTSLLRMKRQAHMPSVLEMMISSHHVRWNCVQQRCVNHPDEAARLDEHGNTLIYNLLNRSVKSYPPVGVVRTLLRAYPQAIWMGMEDNRTPLFAACRRRANYETLRLLMDERPSVKQDSAAVFVFWNSYSELMGGEGELVRFCREAQDREALRIVVRLFHLIIYCTSFEHALKPFTGIHMAASSSSDLTLLKCMIQLFPEQINQLDEQGDLPLHCLARFKGPETQPSSRENRFKLLFSSYPDALQTPDKQGDLPLDLAIKAGWSSLDVLIAEFPESISRRGSEGLFPFQLAACYALQDKALDITYLLLRLQPGLLHHVRDNSIKVSHVAPAFKLSSDVDRGELTPSLAKAIGRIGSLGEVGLWKSFHDMLFHTPRTKSSRHFMHGVNGAASLALCPVGLLEILALHSDDYTITKDGESWSALHHVVVVGNEELRLRAREGFDINDEDLPCMERLRFLLELIPSATRTRDNRGRLPLHLAALHNFPLTGLIMLYEAWPAALLRRDSDDFLYPSLLAATSSLTSLDTVYHLLLACPQVLKR